MRILTKLLTLHFEQTETQIITLSSNALQQWQEFQAEIEKDLRPEGSFSSCIGWGGKLCGYTLRLAGLLHLAEYSALNENNISAQIMSNAIKLATLLAEHAKVAYGLMGVDIITEDAKTAWQWISTLGKNSFTKSEIVLALRHKKCGKADRLKTALNRLITQNLISQPIQLATRKSTMLYYINPVLINNENAG